MASLFKKKKNTWYLSVSYKGKRKSKSLNTKSYKVALQTKNIRRDSTITRCYGNYQK